MHIIYHCVGGTHSSAIASALHLGLLPSDRTATAQELLSIPYFDTITKSQYGNIIPRGIDEYGNSVYTLSRQFYPKIVIKALEDLSIILTGNDTEVIFVNAGAAVNTMMKIGGFLSRRINLVSVGRPIVVKGSQRAYRALIDIVHETKERIRLLKE